MAHQLTRIVYHPIRFGHAYVKHTQEQCAEQVRQSLEKQLQLPARELGYELTKVGQAPEQAQMPAPQS